MEISYWDRVEKRKIGGGEYQAQFGSVSLNIEAEGGESIRVDQATVWVPQLERGQSWPHPNILGLSSFLYKIRIAVDPENNLFYFGTLGE